MRYYPNELMLGLTIIVLFTLLSSLELLKQEYSFDRNLISQDDITKYEKRFNAVKEMLPSRGVIGYISDVETEEILINSDATAKFYLTQYALSPIIIDNSLEHEFIIGNFHQPIKNRDFVVLKNFGNGVILYKTKIK